MKPLQPLLFMTTFLFMAALLFMATLLFKLLQCYLLLHCFVTRGMVVRYLCALLALVMSINSDNPSIYLYVHHLGQNV